MSSPARALADLKNVLFATDYSDCSRLALPYACAIARLYGATVQVVHVIPPEPALAVPMDTLPAALDTVRAVAEASMTDFVSGDALAGVSHRVAVERGSVWEVMAAHVQRDQIDLIVVGTHGRRGWRKLVLGSVAERIFRQASCPVLTVGLRAKQAGQAVARFERILFATDFSSGSLHALSYARSLTERSAARLMLLHVVQDSVEVVVWRSLPEAQAEARQRLNDLLPEEVMRRLKAEVLLECGPAADMILKAAEEKDADLIVMGTHRTRVPAATAHLLWTIASVVVSQAHCPVLTVRS